MKTYGKILEISQNTLLVETANKETFEININDNNRDFINDALNEEIFIILVDTTEQEIVLMLSEKELEAFPEINLETLEGATNPLDDEYI